MSSQFANELIQNDLLLKLYIKNIHFNDEKAGIIEVDKDELYGVLSDPKIMSKVKQ